MSTQWDNQRIARAALIVAVVLVAIWMLWRLLPAFAWAGVLAIATWPARQWLARRCMGNTAIAALLTVVLALVLVLPLITLGVEAAHESRAPWVSDVLANGFGPPPQFLSYIPYVGDRVIAWWAANLSEPKSLVTLFRPLVRHAEANGLMTLTGALGTAVASRLTILVFTVLTLFFLYRDGPVIVSEAELIADRVFGSSGGHLGKHAVVAVRGTVNGLVLVGFAEGVLLGIAYALAGLPHAALLGLLTAVISILPLGAPLVFVICGFALFVQGKTVAAISLIVFGGLIVGIADHFVRPILIGSTTRLPFLWVLLGIFGGLETFGLIGLFLGPAVVAVLIAIWRDQAA